ncbi:MAG: histone deacetylase [Desulfobacterales bacterium]|nr:histone deacetylase [Desulfobacterales bacterium]MBF0397181.1 histone deacetylase [Desulfobacterales bacterium]
MRKTGFLYDDRYLLHDTGEVHPETSERLVCIYKGIKDSGLLSQLTLIKAHRPFLKWILKVHDKDYVNRFERACKDGSKTFESPDNPICRLSFKTAVLAVGGILKAVKLVMKRKIDNAFCAVRPPGHHAEPGKAMGFCFFNNIAIAANYLKIKWGVQRIGIVDFDVHHGNGTQKIFEDDPMVFFYSIHQHPSFAYPGTGREFEKGTGLGEGYTKNTPVLPGMGDETYKKFFMRDFFSAFTIFEPEVILISAGFDAHMDDEMSDMKLSTECFSWMMEKIIEIADKYANGRIISILEGGYCLKRLPELAREHVKLLLYS